jgi:hypothetical protein
MDKKIKNLIDQNVFNTNMLDYGIEIEQDYFDDDFVTLKLIIYVDSYKLYKSSGYFNEDYYNLITDLADGNLDDELFEFLPMVGYSFSSLEIFYDKSNIDGYKNLFYEINELGYSYYKVIQNYYSTPWLYVEFNMSYEDIRHLYEQLEDVVSVEDVVLLSKD